jgi:hypothetical protein
VKDVLAAAAELQNFCEEQDWRFCFIGGVAVQRWSQPRFTHDADMTLLTGIGSEEKFIEKLLSHYRPRFEGEETLALRSRVLRLESSGGVPLDVALGAFPFEERSIARATPWKAKRAHNPLITCSAEDLIVHKAFADRKQDWIDLEGVIIRQGRKLNIEQIWEELRPLVALKEEPEILAKLERILEDNPD